MTVMGINCKHTFDKNMIQYDFTRDLIYCPICNCWTEYERVHDTALRFIYLDTRINNSKTNHTVYSDRMMQWHLEKFNRCCKQVWGNDMQTFYGRQPKEIEKFLNLYFDKDKSLSLVAILTGENCHNGYPYWSFVYQNLCD